MRDVELKVVCELVKDSRQSDRELAKSLKVSQPTITRIRTKLEKEGMLDYTAVPNLPKLGFGIVALVFGKRNLTEHPESHLQKATEGVRKHPSVIFGASGIGLGFDRIGISVHRDYAEYAQFMQQLKKEWAGLMDVDAFLVDLNSKDVVQHLSLKALANSLIKERQQ